ncbi:MAG: hypothetical protein U0946_07600, partial [Patescibacteria group bacterium]|nr:hypothetical protein [Patescibacteria group bacterium]
GQATAGTNWGSVVGGLSLKALLLIPIKFLIGRIAIDNNLVFALVMVLPFLLTVWLLFKGISRNKFYSVWLFVPFLLIVLLSVKLPVLAYFRLLFFLPAFYLLIGSTKSKKLLIGFLCLNLISSFIYLFNPTFHREDWKGLIKSLKQTDQPIIINPAVDAPLKYYYSGEVIYNVPSVPEFWYIPYAEPIFDPELTFRSQITNLGFQEKLVKHFRGNLTLIQYKR